MAELAPTTDTPTGNSPAMTPAQMATYGLIFITNIAATTWASIALPMSLAGNVDMAVVLLFETLIFFIFFAMLDALLEPFVEVEVKLPERMIVLLGVQAVVSAIGIVFGASSTRTPLTLQLSASLLINLLSPFYKLWAFNIPFRAFNQIRWYAIAVGLYVAAFVLCLVDKILHSASGKISAFSLLYCSAALRSKGAWSLALIVVYNVQQEKVQLCIPMERMTGLQYFKVAIALLRRQFSWFHLLAWSAILLSFIPSFDQAGTMNAKIFKETWATFLPFSNWWMNTFLISWILTMITGVFMNKYDSSFNMLTSNLSSVLGLWTGWVPSLMAGTVGFVPSVPLTSAAIGVSLLAIYPSYKYSIHMRDIMARHVAANTNDVEHTGLIQKQ